MVKATNIILKNGTTTAGWQSENILPFVDDDIHICLDESDQ